MDRFGSVREDKINQLKKLIAESKNIVFLGGAGVSTESGIPDFRSGAGIYNTESGTKYRPIDIIAHDFFMEHPEDFFDFYKRKLIYPDARPNKAHKALVRLERQGKLKAIITQNIDNLHQEAGSKCVIELHGSVFRNYCMDCGKKFNIEYIAAQEGVPHCDRCGGIVRPDIVLYEENLEHENVDNAIKAVKKCDLMIIAGTSLTVYPAATFAQFLKHDRIVIINKSSTYMDLKALLTIHDNVGDVLDKCVPKRVSRKTTTSKTTAKKTTAKKTASKTTTAKTGTAKAEPKTASKKAPAKKPSAAASKKPASSKAKKDES
ncbi:MAG: NAD-dependent protein deacylase [Ruminococcaceae bacterium]|nr:NAD-dependent protein deacylase [Oscillospiraceae bacterium]MBQ1247664.1 NAD-dependent protein deacylase [Clostridiales bacterium]